MLRFIFGRSLALQLPLPISYRPSRVRAKRKLHTARDEQISPSTSSSCSQCIRQPSLFPLRPDQGTRFENSSVAAISSVVKSVLTKHLNLQPNDMGAFDSSKLKDLLLKLVEISPQSARRFLRLSDFKPDDVLEILTRFEFKCDKPAAETRKVACLWEVFRRPKNRDFKHLPRSFIIMAKLLLRVGMLRELDFLLSTAEAQGLSLGAEVSSGLMKGYVFSFQLEKAVYIYDKIVSQGLYPSALGYNALLNFLIHRDEDQFVIRVFSDMLFAERVHYLKGGTLENVIMFLCRKEKIQEARNMIRKTLSLNIDPTSQALGHVAIGYCCRNEFEDIIDLYTEMNCSPDFITGNRILLYICKKFGTRRADLFLRELLHLGFCPNSRTFGILIGWSCYEGNLKSAFVCLSEMKSRKLKPARCSYNAIISGLFMKGLSKLTREVIHEMEDNNIMPGLSTFRVLIAGYCKGRRFEEAKEIVSEMTKLGLAPNYSLSDDPLCHAFLSVGLDPLFVKVKRDNDIVRVRTEFFDKIGNGLYLEADIDEYEVKLTGIFHDSMIPDFDLHVIETCGNGSVEYALKALSKINSWGHSLSLEAISALVKALSTENCHTGITDHLRVKIFESIHRLDEETLNAVLVLFCMNGEPYNGRVVLDILAHRNLSVKQEAYTGLIMGFCRERNSAAVIFCWEAARTQGWLPNMEEFGTLVSFLCEQGMLKEAWMLFEAVILYSSHLILNACEVFVEKLFVTGNASLASDLVKELAEKGYEWNSRVENDVKVFCGTHDNVIKRLCSCGGVRNAVDLLNLMLTEGNIPESTSYDVLVKGLCVCNSVDLAIDFHAEMLARGLEPALETWRAVFDKLCADGRSTEAERVLIDMLEGDRRPERVMYKTLIDRYRLEKNFEKVSEMVTAMIRSGYEPDFDSHWCVITKLRDSIEDSSRGRGFLFNLLSGSGAVGCSDGRVGGSHR